MKLRMLKLTPQEELGVDQTLPPEDASTHRENMGVQFIDDK